MLRSAIASRSAVVIPGRTASRSSSSVRPTTKPASRIFTISASDLYSITRLRLLNMRLSAQPVGPGLSVSSTEPVQRRRRPVRHVVHRAGRVDAHQHTLVSVEPDKWRGLFGVDLEPVPNGLLTVVVPLEQLAATVVAHARLG